MFSLRFYWLCDLAGVGWTKVGGFIGTWCCGIVLSWDWATGSANGCTAFGAGVGIGGAGVCNGFGMGRVTLVFLLIPALPCPILGLGMCGIIFVGGPWSIVCVWCIGLVWHVGGVGSVVGATIDFWHSGLMWGIKPLSTPWTSDTFVPIDFAWDLVCTNYLSVSVKSFSLW